MNETSIHADVGNNVKLDMDANGIVLNANGAATIHINSSGEISITCSNMNINSSAVNWNASSVTFGCSGAFTVSASAINLG